MDRGERRGRWNQLVRNTLSILADSLFLQRKRVGARAHRDGLFPRNRHFPGARRTPHRSSRANENSVAGELPKLILVSGLGVGSDSGVHRTHEVRLRSRDGIHIHPGSNIDSDVLESRVGGIQHRTLYRQFLGWRYSRHLWMGVARRSHWLEIQSSY